MSEINYLGKIATAKIGLDKNVVKDACKSKPASICRIYGIASKVEYGESSLGAWKRLRGQFEAVNLLTGEIFRSGACHLPGIAESILEPEVVTGMRDENFAGTQFGFVIGAVKTDSPVGYEYTVKPLIESASADPLLALREKAGTLPKPKEKK